MKAHPTATPRQQDILAAHAVAAYRHRLALVLPDAGMACPTGVGRAIATHSMPIEGRDEWVAAARRLA